jgi:RNA polymerase sigma-54 factor
MNLTQTLAQKQSLLVSMQLQQAISLLIMDNDELETTIEEKLKENPFLKESPHDSFRQRADSDSAYDIALETVAMHADFRDSLLNQLGLIKFNELEKRIAYMLIQSIDDNGLLSDKDEVFLDISSELHVFPEWIESVRKRLMEFEPLGCGATSISEAIAVQLRSQKAQASGALKILLDKILRSEEKNIDKTALKRLMHEHKITKLEKIFPRPALGFLSKKTQEDYAIPDLILENDSEELTLRLLKRHSQGLVVQESNLKSSLAAAERKFMRQKAKEAGFFVKSLRYRENALFMLAESIVKIQAAWFLGKGDLKALSLSQLADLCQMHESTVSRLLRNKFISSSRGTFELRYFLSHELTQSNKSNNISARAIKEKLHTIIQHENKLKPLSDQELCTALKDINIAISRRTVAKYRDALKIAAAHARRRFS